MVYSIPYVLIPFFVWCCAQFTKICVDFYQWRPITRQTLRASWWIPSTHWTLTSSMLTLVFLVDWIASTLFMVVLVLSVLIWYDATNVRYESWKHAQYINSLKKEINHVFLVEHKHTQLPTLFLKERIWHTPLEVLVGICYWSILTLFLHFILNYFDYQIWYL